MQEQEKQKSIAQAATQPDNSSPTSTVNEAGIGPVGIIASLFAGLFAAMVVFWLVMFLMCLGIVPGSAQGVRFDVMIAVSTFPATIVAVLAIWVVSRHFRTLHDHDRPGDDP